jgi:hypothetical protein
MEIFNPVKYSLEENKFFLTHLGESPVAALQEKLPLGVNPVAVEEVLGGVYELDELEKHRGIKWAGKDALIKTINKYLTEWDRWKEMSSRGAPRFPSMHAWDGRGRPHRGGVTSDAGSVNTYLEDNGERTKFSVDLQYSTKEKFIAPWAKPEAPVPDACVEDHERGVIECPIDGWTANFKPESRQSYNMARARMSKHCRASKDERMREFAMKVFG